MSIMPFSVLFPFSREQNWTISKEESWGVWRRLRFLFFFRS